MPRIFLSHSSDDKFEALALKTWLAAEGWSDVFLDLDPKDGIAAGERWEGALHAAASHCEAVVFLVSAHWLASGWCKKEFMLARGLNKRLFAALIDAEQTIGALPAELTDVWQVIDLVHGQDLVLFPTRAPGAIEERHIGYSRSGLIRLKRGLEKAGLDATTFPWPPGSDPNRDPYRGFEPLDANDAGIYFGREAELAEAVDQLRGIRNAPMRRLFVILGASGAGKSSFLRAGLLPRLERDDVRFVVLPIIRPGHAALTNENGGFVDALASVLQGHSRREIERLVGEGLDTFGPLLADHARSGAATPVPGEDRRPPSLVIAIDQAEELFGGHDPDESDRLLALLADMVKAEDPSVIVIFAIRSDSYARLQKADALKGVDQTLFSLAAMPPGAYADVIEGPARRVEEAGGKLKVEPALKQQLLSDIGVGSGDALPLLALTLQQLYRNYPNAKALRLADYHDLGGLKGAVGAAVKRALGAADKNQKIPVDRSERLALMRRGLIPWLATVDPDTKSPRRNIARLEEIPEESAPLIELLAAERLLSIDAPSIGEQGPQSRIEPTHEALLRQWELLADWLKEDAGRLTTLEEVRRSAAHWDANERNEAWLEHHGKRLSGAQSLDSRPDIAARLDDIDRAYLAGCAKREREWREKDERLSQEREAANTRDLAATRKIAFRTRIFAGVATALLGLAANVAVLALEQRTIARQNEAIALTRLADAQAESRPIEATKLALAGLRDKEAALGKGTPRFSLTGLFDKAGAALTTRPPVDESAILTVLGRSVPNLRQLAVFNNAGRYAEFTPDGKKIIAAMANGSELRLLDPNSQQPISPLLNYRGAVFATVSNDGRLMLTRSPDATRLWNPVTGRTVAKLEDRNVSAEYTAAALSPDGSRAVTASVSLDSSEPRHPRIQVWSVQASADAVHVRSLLTLGGRSGEEHTDKVNSIAFTRDGTRIVTTSDDKTARVWNVTSGQCEVTLALADRGLYAAFKPDGTQVITVSDDDTAELWRASDGSPVGKPPIQMSHKRRINSAVFSPDGTQILTASDDGTARLWDASSGVALATLAGHDGKVRSAEFSPTGAQIVTASDDDSIRIWDNARGRTYLTLKGHGAPLWSASFDKNGTHVVTASKDGVALIWDTRTGLPVGEPMQHRKEVTYAAFNALGDRIVTSSAADGTQIWNSATGKLERSFQDANATYAVFSPDGQRIATAYDDGRVRIRSAATGRLIADTIDLGHKGRLWSVEFDRDGNRIVTASGDRTARVWDTRRRSVLSILSHLAPVFSASFSPDGKQVVTASEDNIAYVWDVASSDVVRTLTGHDHWVNSGEFSPDGTRIVTGSKDGTARLWDATTGQSIAVLVGHNGGVESVAFSEDGKSIVTASDDKTARLWDVSAIPAGDIVHVACKLLNGNTGVEGLAEGLTFDRPICETDSPPPNLQGAPAAAKAQPSPSEGHTE